MNNVINYIYKDHPLRVVDGQGEPWFVAQDICRALEIQNSAHAISRLDPEDTNTIVLNDGKRGNPKRTIINESAMYELILSSRKKEALYFKRWITREVLPSIKKHGAYMTDAKTEELEKKPEELYALAEALIKEKQEREAISRQKSNLIEENKGLHEELILKEDKIWHQEEEIKHLQKAQDYLNTNIIPSGSLVTSTELGAMRGMSAIALHRWLADKGVLRWVNDRYVPTSRYSAEELTRDVCYSFEHTDGTIGTSRRIMWTEKGVLFVLTLFDALKNEIKEQGEFELEEVK